MQKVNNFRLTTTKTPPPPELLIYLNHMLKDSENGQGINLPKKRFFQEILEKVKPVNPNFLPTEIKPEAQLAWVASSA